MKKICMIAVGGTIASVETKEGLRPEIASEEILTYIPGSVKTLSDRRHSVI